MIPAPFSFREPPCLSPFHGRSFFCHHTKKEPKKKSPSAHPYNHPPCGSGKMPSKDSGNFSITASWQDRASSSPPVADGAHSMMHLLVCGEEACHWNWGNERRYSCGKQPRSARHIRLLLQEHGSAGKVPGCRGERKPCEVSFPLTRACGKEKEAEGGSGRMGRKTPNYLNK